MVVDEQTSSIVLKIDAVSKNICYCRTGNDRSLQLELNPMTLSSMPIDPVDDRPPKRHTNAI